MVRKAGSKTESSNITGWWGARKKLNHSAKGRGGAHDHLHYKSSDDGSSLWSMPIPILLIILYGIYVQNTAQCTKIQREDDRALE